MVGNARLTLPLFHAPLSSAPELPIHIPPYISIRNRLAAVVVPLAFGQGKLHLDYAAFEIQLQRNQRLPFFRHAADKTPDLRFVEQQASFAHGLVIEMGRVLIEINVDIVQKHLAVIDVRITVRQTHLARP